MKIKTLILIIALVTNFSCVLGQPKLEFSIFNVEKIEIMGLDVTATGIQRTVFNREHFDEIFDDAINNRIANPPAVLYDIIDNDEEIVYFVTILDGLTLVDKDKIQIYPDDIVSNPNWQEKNPSHPTDNEPGDPIETRAKINIYMRNGSVITAFWSPLYLDIFNNRYIAFPLSKIIDYKGLCNEQPRIDDYNKFKLYKSTKQL